MDKITVIIPVKNEEEKIERCLKAVFDQITKPCEVIVVDGHSTENHADSEEVSPEGLI